MSDIKTLIKDIYATVVKKDGWFTDELAQDYATSLSKTLQKQMNEEHKPRLRLSQMGPKCPCELWHSIHHPEHAEVMPAWAEIKFSFGHMIEAQAIMLAKAAGHEVTGEQDHVELDGISGHRDCVIDGCIVDVKSSSSRGFPKFADGTLGQADTFGYLDQLDGYLAASREDPLVRIKDTGYILAVDKTLGHMALYEHKLREDSIRERIELYKRIVQSEEPPKCTCGIVADGKSGNLKLDTKASYSAYKHCCFPKLRTFLYASGPVYLTKVVRKPDVIEVDRHGKAVYN